MTKLYQLGPFRLDAEAQTLFRGTEAVALGRRAVAVLLVLVERSGAPVSKDGLIGAAWSGLAVEDANLSVQIAALRKVLSLHPGGERWIETLPRRGYRYVGPLAAEATGAQSNEVAPVLALPDRPSIAVLPFQNISGDAEQEYFADGMVDEIITGLARIKSLFVIARNSTFAFKGRTMGVKQVGQELGVRYVLQGSVRKAANRVRVTAQLVAAESGAHLWADRYDRPLGEIFGLQDEITLSVVGAIEPSLREAEIARVKRKRPDSADAYDLVLRALPYAYPATPEGAAMALPFLESALALETDYASAHGLLAWCHEILFVHGGFDVENRSASIRHGRAAISSGRDDATALALGAFAIAMVEHDRATAFAAFEQALSVSPSSAFTLFLGCVALAYAGEARRASDWAERALRISPFDRLCFGAYHGLAVSHFLLGRYEDAANAGRRAAQFNPGFSVSNSLLVAPLAKLGRMDEAKSVAARVLALQPSFRASRFCTALALPPELANAMVEAWRAAGLPS